MAHVQEGGGVFMEERVWTRAINIKSNKCFQQCKIEGGYFFKRVQKRKGERKERKSERKERGGQREKMKMKKRERRKREGEKDKQREREREKERERERKKEEKYIEK